MLLLKTTKRILIASSWHGQRTIFHPLRRGGTANKGKPTVVKLKIYIDTHSKTRTHEPATLKLAFQCSYPPR